MGMTTMKMNRRKLLCSASAAVIAAKLMFSVQPVAAATPTYDYSDVPIWTLEQVEKAFDVMGGYKFGLHAHAKLLGMNPRAMDGFVDLHPALASMPYLPGEFWGRVTRLITIRLTLKRQLGPNVSEHLFWLSSNRGRSGKTFREMMEGGDYADLGYVMTSADRIA